jgi:hypothetical protein
LQPGARGLQFSGMLGLALQQQVAQCRDVQRYRRRVERRGHGRIFQY